MRCRSSSWIVIWQCHFGADRRPVAVDFQVLHRERKHDVSFREIIQAPAAEQLGEVVDDDQVGVEQSPADPA